MAFWAQALCKQALHQATTPVMPTIVPAALDVPWLLSTCRRFSYSDWYYESLGLQCTEIQLREDAMTRQRTVRFLCWGEWTCWQGCWQETAVDAPILPYTELVVAFHCHAAPAKIKARAFWSYDGVNYIGLNSDPRTSRFNGLACVASCLCSAIGRLFLLRLPPRSKSLALQLYHI